MLNVNNIRIRRFKILNDVYLDLEAVNVLVGANNSGKSAILQAIQFIISASQCVGPNGLVTGNPHHTATIAPAELYYSPVDEVMSLSHQKELTQKIEEGIQIDFGIETGGANDSFYVNVAKGKNGTLSVRTDRKKYWKEICALGKPFSMYVPGLAGVAPKEQYVTPAEVRRAAARGHGNAVLRNVLWQLHFDSGKWETFSEQLGVVFPGHSVVVRHDPEADGFVHAFLQSGEQERPLGLAGTGFLQVVQILAYVNLYSPNLLLLDEPDSHIHPDKQRALLSVIRDWASCEGAKVIIATHSRHLLDSMDGSAAFFWMRNGVRQEKEEFTNLKVLMDIGALDRSDKLRSGQTDAVILTEDATAADNHPRNKNSALRIILQASGVNMDRVQVWSYVGCTNLQTAKVLAGFIIENAPNTKILIHRDRDYEAEEDISKLKSQLESMSNVDVFITDGVDTESHLISVEHILYLHPDLDRQSVESAIYEATQESREDSLRRYADAHDGFYRYLKDKPNTHDLATQRMCDFDDNPKRYRYGKKVLGVLSNKIQAIARENRNIRQPSDHIIVPIIRDFAKKLGH